MMKINAANRLEGIGEYYFASKLREIDQLRLSGKDVINLGIGSPDLAPHPSVIARLAQSAADPSNHAYQSYKGVPALRQAMQQWYSRWYGVQLDPATEILPLMGSKEGIMHISMALLNPGDKVLIPNPGYPTYTAVSKICGAEVLPYDLRAENNWEPDIDAIEQNGLNGVKLMWVNYPHMPTGAPATKALYQRLVNFANKHGILICNDNPYSFILNDEPLSMLAVDGANGPVLELNSLSKAQNMAGWRVGMLVGNSTYLNEVMRFKTNMDSGMFKPVQEAAIAALELDADWYLSLNQVYASRRHKAIQLLQQMGCQFQTQQTGMFLWAQVNNQFADGYAMSDYYLNQSAVFITPGGIFGSQGNRYIRISLCSTEAVFEEAIQRIKEL